MRAGKDACLHHVNFACQRLICVAIFSARAHQSPAAAKGNDKRRKLLLRQRRMIVSAFSVPRMAADLARFPGRAFRNQFADERVRLAKWHSFFTRYSARSVAAASIR